MVRVKSPASEFKNWHRCLRCPPRRWKALVLNPEGNLYLAYGALLEQATEDAFETPKGCEQKFEQSVSYQLVEQLARDEIAQLYPGEDICGFQFKICALPQGAPDGQMEEILVSRVYEDSIK